MGWEITRNRENAVSNTTITGFCRLYEENAEVTSFYRCRIECKTDLQETYSFKGYKCSLEEKNGVINPSCVDNCPFIRKKHL